MAAKSRKGTFGTVGWVLRGAAAGAAGATALNVVTYLDMAVRGRPASSTPGDTVERLAATTHLTVPGDGATRTSRVEALGALTGLVAGIGVEACSGSPELPASAPAPW